MISFKMGPVQVDMNIQKSKEDENTKFWRNVPSLDNRGMMAPKKSAPVSSKVRTIGVAYNKGPVMVIPEDCIKDMGK